MREILFKAKRADNGEWVTGYYIKSLVEGSVYGYIRESRAGTDIKIMLNTLCQYTGLTDKNENKIWENDVVIVNERYKGKVIWSEIWTNYMVIDNGNINISINNRWADVYEVIGNIFDNKELLEV